VTEEADSTCVYVWVDVVSLCASVCVCQAIERMRMSVKNCLLGGCLTADRQQLKEQRDEYKSQSCVNCMQALSALVERR
jgi:hypothetical protein